MVCFFRPSTRTSAQPSKTQTSSRPPTSSSSGSQFQRSVSIVPSVVKFYSLKHFCSRRNAASRRVCHPRKFIMTMGAFRCLDLGSQMLWCPQIPPQRQTMDIIVWRIPVLIHLFSFLPSLLICIVLVSILFYDFSLFVTHTPTFRALHHVAESHHSQISLLILLCFAEPQDLGKTPNSL